MNKIKAAVLVICVAGWGNGPGHAQGNRTTWTDYGGSPDNARHFTSSQIDKSNLDQLRVEWTYPTNDNISYVFNPIVVDNVMFVLARNNSLVALDATTGKEIWVHEGLQGIAPRGINYWESKDRSDRRLLFQLNSYLQAIDARTGRSITTFGKDGAVNLREGLGRDPATIVKTQSSTPGKIFENLIILGSAAGENYMAPAGDLRGGLGRRSGAPRRGRRGSSGGGRVGDADDHAREHERGDDHDRREGCGPDPGQGAPRARDRRRRDGGALRPR